MPWASISPSQIMMPEGSNFERQTVSGAGVVPKTVNLPQRIGCWPLPIAFDLFRLRQCCHGRIYPFCADCLLYLFNLLVTVFEGSENLVTDGTGRLGLVFGCPRLGRSDDGRRWQVVLA